MPKNVVQTRLGADLDMTAYKLSKDKLKAQIIDDVKATQIFAGRHLPDKLIITKPQFTLLEDDTVRMEETKERLYVTPYNVMEVKVVH